MDVKKIALLVGALVIAVVTAVMAKNMFAGAGAEQADAAPAVPLGPKVLVARKALPVGTIIDAESLAYPALAEGAGPERLLHRRRARGRHRQAARHRRPQPDHRRSAAHPGALVGPNDRGFLAAALGPGMRAVTVPVERTERRRRLRLPGRPRRHGPDPGGRRRRRRPAAQGFRDDRPQRARARHRPAHRQQGRGRQDRGQDLLQRHDRSHSAHRREDRRRADASARCRCRCARSPTIRPSSSARSPPARSSCRRAPTRPRSASMLLAVANRPIDTNTTFTHRWRRVALPAPQRPGRALERRRPRPMAASPSPGPAASPAGRPVRSSASLAATMSPSFRWELAKMTSRIINRRRSPGHRPRRAGHSASARVAAAGPGRRPAGRCRAPVARRWTCRSGEGQMVRLSAPMTDVFDRQPRGRRRPGPLAHASSTCSARAAAKRRSIATDQVGPRRLRRERPRRPRTSARSTRCCSLAMPEARASRRRRSDNMVLLTGTVASPDDADEAAAAGARPIVGEGTSRSISRAQARRRRCRSTSRSASPKSTAALLKQIGVNLLSQRLDQWLPVRRRPGPGHLPADRRRRRRRRSAGASQLPVGTTLGAAGKLFGLDILGALDLAENDGLVTTSPSRT